MSKLCGVPLSPMVRKVLLALEIKQIDHEVVPGSPFKKPEGFEKISPLKKIHAWEDESVTLADSTVICEYLEDYYPEQPLYPKTPEDRAKARWFEEYADTIMLSVMGTVFLACCQEAGEPACRRNQSAGNITNQAARNLCLPGVSGSANRLSIRG